MLNLLLFQPVQNSTRVLTSTEAVPHLFFAIGTKTGGTLEGR